MLITWDYPHRGTLPGFDAARELSSAVASAVSVVRRHNGNTAVNVMIQCNHCGLCIADRSNNVMLCKFPSNSMEVLKVPTTK